MMSRREPVLLVILASVCLLTGTHALADERTFRLQAKVLSLSTELAEAKRNTSCLKEKPQQCTPRQLGSRDHPASSCLQIANDRAGKARSGAYYLSSNGSVYEVYCHMEGLGSCGGKGWTTLMKVDGRKSTFHYKSALWTNHQLYKLAGGKTGFDYHEAKLHTFSETSFKSLCLVFRSFNTSRLGYVKIRKPAPSLYTLIKNSSYKPSHAGRTSWMSSINGARLQPGCNREGFNIRHPQAFGIHARIGILGNNQNDCSTPDSVIGIGIQHTFGSCHYIYSPGISAGYWSPKSVNICRSVKEDVYSGQAFVYIMAE